MFITFVVKLQDSSATLCSPFGRSRAKNFMQADDEARWLVALISDVDMCLSEAAGLHIDDIKLDAEV